MSPMRAGMDPKSSLLDPGTTTIGDAAHGWEASSDAAHGWEASSGAAHGWEASSDSRQSPSRRSCMLEESAPLPDLGPLLRRRLLLLAAIALTGSIIGLGIDQVTYWRPGDLPRSVLLGELLLHGGSILLSVGFLAVLAVRRPSERSLRVAEPLFFLVGTLLVGRESSGCQCRRPEADQDGHLTSPSALHVVSASIRAPAFRFAKEGQRDSLRRANHKRLYATDSTGLRPP